MQVVGRILGQFSIRGRFLWSFFRVETIAIVGLLLGIVVDVFGDLRAGRIGQSPVYLLTLWKAEMRRYRVSFDSKSEAQRP